MLINSYKDMREAERQQPPPEREDDVHTTWGFLKALNRNATESQRELLARCAMQGLLAGEDCTDDYLVRRAYQIADKMLAHSEVTRDYKLPPT